MYSNDFKILRSIYKYLESYKPLNVNVTLFGTGTLLKILLGSYICDPTYLVRLCKIIKNDKYLKFLGLWTQYKLKK